MAPSIARGPNLATRFRRAQQGWNRGNDLDEGDDEDDSNDEDVVNAQTPVSRTFPRNNPSRLGAQPSRPTWQVTVNLRGARPAARPCSTGAGGPPPPATLTPPIAPMIAGSSDGSSLSSSPTDSPPTAESAPGPPNQSPTQCELEPHVASEDCVFKVWRREWTAEYEHLPDDLASGSSERIQYASDALKTLFDDFEDVWCECRPHVAHILKVYGSRIDHQALAKVDTVVQAVVVRGVVRRSARLRARPSAK